MGTIKKFDDEERIKKNYCCQYIRRFLIYRFSMEKLEKIAKKQGLQKGWKNRSVEVFVFFEDKIYNALDEKLKNIIIKSEEQLFFPYDSIKISNEEIKYLNKFEEILYNIVK